MEVLDSEGTVFEVESAVTGVWNAICIRDLSGLGGGQSTVKDRTTLCSTAKEKGMGLPDEGQATLNTLYDPANAGHKRLQALRAAQEAGAFRLTLTDTGAEVWTFDAFVLSAALGGLTPDGDVTMDFGLEVTGSITIT